VVGATSSEGEFLVSVKRVDCLFVERLLLKTFCLMTFRRSFTTWQIDQRLTLRSYHGSGYYCDILYQQYRPDAANCYTPSMAILVLSGGWAITDDHVRQIAGRLQLLATFSNNHGSISLAFRYIDDIFFPTSKGRFGHPR